MSRWKLGSMVTKWVISPTYKWFVYWDYNLLNNLLLTSWDVQVGSVAILGNKDLQVGPLRTL